MTRANGGNGRAQYYVYQLSGTVDTTKQQVRISTDQYPQVNYIYIQNTHSANSLFAYFTDRGGDAFTTITFGKNLAISAPRDDRIVVRNLVLRGSAAATTWEILTLIGSDETKA